MGWAIAMGIWALMLALAWIPCIESLTPIQNLLSLFMFCVLCGLSYRSWYHSRAHCCFKEGKKALREDAKLTDMLHKKVGFRYAPKIQTTICFDDGFTYISHNCTVDNYIVFQKASLSEQEKSEIVLDAYEAHSNAIAKRDQKAV